MSIASNSDSKRVLVLRFSAAGDVVLTASALSALRQALPGCQIAFATKAAYADLMATHPAINEIIALSPGESLRSYLQRLRAFGPDAILDLHGKLRSRILCSLLRPPYVVSWRKRSLRQTLAVRFGGARFHVTSTIAERYHEAVERLLRHEAAPGHLTHHSSTEHLASARSILEQHKIRLDQPIIGISPGAMWETKRWPADRFGALAKRLGDAGYQVFVAGSSAEAEITQAVCAAAPNAVDLAGVLNLTALAAAISLCDAFIANDSGPMHLARAHQVPTLAVFGSTAPEQFDFTGHRYLFANTSCAPCSFHGRSRCPRGHLRCLNDIEVDDAWNALQTLLQGPRRSQPVLG